jgi:hypothetical protein
MKTAVLVPLLKLGSADVFTTQAGHESPVHGMERAEDGRARSVGYLIPVLGLFCGFGVDLHALQPKMPHPPNSGGFCACTVSVAVFSDL